MTEIPNKPTHATNADGPSTEEALDTLIKISSATHELVQRQQLADGHASTGSAGFLLLQHGLPKHKCGDKGTIVGDGPGKGSSWFFFASGKAAALTAAQTESDNDAKDKAKQDAGDQMTNFLCQTGCKPSFDTANPVVKIVSSAEVLPETTNAAGVTGVSWASSATYEINWECK